MYSDALPFIFVFGVATTVDAVHRALPHSVTSLLTMQTLTAEPSIVILDRFIKAVVTSKEIPLKLGSRIIQEYI
jgi:origin recognition complex subunit 3